MKPTLLFPLDVRGIGTADVESLGSYLHRLASIHHVSVGRLLDRAIELKADLDDQPGDSLTRFDNFHSYGGLGVLVRPNETNQRLLSMLMTATGNTDLSSTTFISLRSALHRSMNTFADAIRWCPLCMAEHEAAEDGGYFKLLWSFKAVTHCPDHGVALIEECPGCGQHQSGLGRKGPCVRCSHCGGSLGQIPGPLDVMPSWQRTHGDLQTLVEKIANEPTVSFPTNGVESVVSQLFDIAWDRGEEAQLWQLIPRDECLAIVHGQIPMTLAHARLLSFRLRIDLVDLLSGEAIQADDLFDGDWRPVPSDLKRKKRRAKHDRRQILERVKAIVDRGGQDAPPPLRQVANAVGVSTGHLRYQFPMVAKDIVETHKAWKARVLRQQSITAKAEVMKFAAECFATNQPLSKKRALATIRANTAIPKHTLRKAIAAAFPVLLTNP